LKRRGGFLNEWIPLFYEEYLEKINIILLDLYVTSLSSGPTSAQVPGMEEKDSIAAGCRLLKH
jgi:hypothetical protein